MFGVLDNNNNVSLPSDSGSILSVVHLTVYLYVCAPRLYMTNFLC